MSLTIQFALRDTKGGGLTAINLKAYHRSFNREGRLLYSTGERIIKTYFDPVTQRPKDKRSLKGLTVNERLELDRITQKLNEIENEVIKLYNYLTVQKLPIYDERFRQELDKSFRKENKVSSAIQTLNFNTFLKNFITDIKEGNRLTNEGKRYAPESVKNYLTFQVQFNLYQTKRRRKIDFEDITMDFYNDFVLFLTQKGYMPNTIGKNVSRIKKLMDVAKEEGLHKNLEYQRRAFKALDVESDSIALSDQDVSTLFNLQFEEKPHLELYRDIFLIGCYTAQRVSDYNRIQPEYIRTTPKGTRVIQIAQKKTGQQVEIPIRPELEFILKKYDYKPPKVAEQKLNKHLKDIGKLAGFTDQIEITTYKGGQRFSTLIPKYELIKSHTARRTGATNMIRAGLNTIEVMKITGHKEESTFAKYVKLGREEVADMLGSHEYFTKPTLSLAS